MSSHASSRITFIGAGQVGAPLAARLAAAGHEVTLAASREGSGSVARALGRHPSLAARPVEEAVSGAEVVFLAVPFGAVEGVLSPLASQLAGKVLVDCTNPVGPGLSHGLQSVRSGSARIQELAPEAHVVKAFTIYGFENFEDSSYPGYGVQPAMLYCGDSAAARAQVSGLIAACAAQAPPGLLIPIEQARRVVSLAAVGSCAARREVLPSGGGWRCVAVRKKRWSTPADLIRCRLRRPAGPTGVAGAVVRRRSRAHDRHPRYPAASRRLSQSSCR